MSIAACGSSSDADAGTDEGGAGGVGGNGTGGTVSGSGGAASTGGAAPTWPTGPLRPTRYRIPDPSVEALPCGLAGNGTITESEVLLGQTHLTPANWPFQTVSATRPLTIAVAAKGTGSAPAFTATAHLGGKDFAFCLKGPTALPSSTVDLEAATYRGSLPAEWVQPGLTIDVTFGGTTETLEPEVKAENGLTLYFVDAQLFGEGTNEETSEERLREMLARLPVSYLDVGMSPFGTWKPTHLLVDARSDGTTPTGATTSHGKIIIDENPHCSSADKSAGTCTLHSGYGTMSAVLSHLDTFREANGVSDSSTWYADLSIELGGGLAGGQRGTGDDTGLVMNHELGHAWGFPHWAAGDTEYPYEGVQRERGGFGDRWALDQVTGLLLSPQCEGLERQSPMQRAGSCVPEGSTFDPYSDYEAARLLRMTLGATTEVSGNVAYNGGVLAGATRSFLLPEESGRPKMVWEEGKAGMKFEVYDETSNAFEAFVSTEWNRIEEAEVPVVMFSGALIRGGESFIEEPIEYVGNVLRKLDPTVAEDYAVIWDGRYDAFYWARDLSFRFTLDDDSEFYRLYGREAVLRADGDGARFAFNLPKALGERVVKVEVLSRPLGQYDAASSLSESDSAENFYDAAVVLATWDR